jgi:two-component system, NarL family, sensor kinase
MDLAVDAGPTVSCIKQTHHWLTHQLLAITVLVMVEAMVAVGLYKLTSLGLSFGTLLLSYGVTNAWLGGTFAPFGALVAYRRPDLPTGWLFLAFGLFYAASALGISVMTGHFVTQTPVSRWIAFTANVLWTPAVAFCFPLILLLFPNGRLASPRWRWLVATSMVIGAIWVVTWALQAPDGPVVLHGSAVHEVSRLETISNYGLLIVFISCLIPLVMRWRNATGRLHAQLAWLVIGSTTAVVLFLPTGWGVTSYWATGLLIGVPLFPVACTVAILRHQLFDLDMALNRTLVYATLSAGIFGLYLLIVELARVLVGTGAELGGSVVAAALVAVIFVPSRALIQRAVSGLMYGSRADPARTMSTLSASLEGPADDELSAAVGAIAQSLRLSNLVVVVDGREIGTAQGEATPTRIALRFRDQDVGELLAWPRRGQAHLDPEDIEALRFVAGPLATAVHSVQLTDQLQRSRQQIMETRTAERKRLHRDLHDGLGPALTAVALKADAAGNVVDGDPSRAKLLIDQIASEAREAIGDVRRIAHGLRPPTLDQYGLLESVSYEAHRFTSRLDGHPLIVNVDLPPSLPPLSDGTAAAAYRIVTEALTNVARHSNASRVTVTVECGTSFCLEVMDDGSSADQSWPEGFGISSMRRRALDCGGILVAGPTTSGGYIRAELPLVAVGSEQ